MTAYQVAPDKGLVLARTPNGIVYVYEPGFVPADTDAAQLEQLVSERMVVEVQPVSFVDTSESAVPAKSADKATWVAYAVSQGAAADDAEKATKDELIELYGKA